MRRHHRSAEPDSLVVKVDFNDRTELLVTDPDVYYVTEHYVGYPSVLVRLSRVHPDVLRELLGMAYKFVTRKAVSRSPARKRREVGRRKQTRPCTRAGKPSACRLDA